SPIGQTPISAHARGNGDRLQHRESGEEKDQGDKDGLAKTEHIGQHAHGQWPDNGGELSEDAPESEKLRGAVGAFACGSLQDKVGSRATLSVSLLLWCAVALGAYFSAGKTAFFIVGNLAGLAIGSSQAASRAVVTLLSPRDRAAEFFGFWGVFGKFAAIVGPLAMGALADMFGLRESILVTLVFFLAGLAVLQSVAIPSRVR
ncbi:MAG: MFS transporter, partial [Chthoniobacterales bacterium]